MLPKMHRLSGLLLQVLTQVVAATAIYFAPPADSIARADAAIEAGIVAFDAGRYEEALGQFRHHLVHHPNCSVALGNIGRCYHRLGNYAESLQYFNSALALSAYGDVIGDPLLAQRNDFFGRGETLFAMARYKEAASDLREAILGEPRNSYLRFLRGRSLFYTDAHKAAVEELLQASNLGYSEGPLIHHYRGRAYCQLGESRRALEEFDQAISENPSDFRNYLGRAIVLVSNGSVDEAIREVDVDLIRMQALDQGSQFMAILGYVGRLLEGDESSARRFAQLSVDRCRSHSWPVPILDYMAGNLSSKDLYARAESKAEMTDVQALFCIKAAVAGRAEEVTERIGWLKANGERDRHLLDCAFRLGSGAIVGTSVARSEFGGRIVLRQRPYVDSSGRPELLDLPETLPDLPDLPELGT